MIQSMIKQTSEIHQMKTKQNGEKKSNRKFSNIYRDEIGTCQVTIMLLIFVPHSTSDSSNNYYDNNKNNNNKKNWFAQPKLFNTLRDGSCRIISSLYISHTLSPSLTRWHTHVHTHTLSLSHLYIYIHLFTHSLSLSFSVCVCACFCCYLFYKYSHFYQIKKIK